MLAERGRKLMVMPPFWIVRPEEFSFYLPKVQRGEP